MTEYLLLPQDVNELHLPLESLQQIPELLLLRPQERLALFQPFRVTLGLLLRSDLVSYSPLIPHNLLRGCVKILKVASNE